MPTSYKLQRSTRAMQTMPHPHRIELTWLRERLERLLLGQLMRTRAQPHGKVARILHGHVWRIDARHDLMLDLA
jgi:hypothetical protein